jgi:hypothetical protein
LIKKDFDLFDIRKGYMKRKNILNYCDRKKGQLITGDALYIRSPETILRMSGITQEKILRSICVYLVYGYPDMAKTLFDLAKDKGILSNEVKATILSTLSKFRDLIPYFRGKYRMRDLFNKCTNYFSIKAYSQD